MAKKTKTTEKKKQVVTLTHEEASRKNIPTAEYQSVMHAKEQAAVPVKFERGVGGLEAEKTKRNRDLDPQLVWRGKDEQDWSDLVTYAPPLYIQEKVHPKALIDDLTRRTAAGAKDTADQFDLFADFNGVPEGNAKTEFYQHDANWTNRMILGDSLQVMASLAEREGLRGQVQCIYIDPPYGIKFNSNFQWSTTSRDVSGSDKLVEMTREPEQVKAFRDTWRDHIHSYLTYLRDRLTIARDLLNDTGSIFVQIGDDNVHRVRSLMDEVFGDKNFISLITIAKTGGQPGPGIPNVSDHILWFCRDKERVKLRSVYLDKVAGIGAGSGGRYTQTDETDRTFRLVTLTSAKPPGDFPISFEGRDYRPVGRYWTTGRMGAERLKKAGRVVAGAKTINFKKYIEDFPAYTITNVWGILRAVLTRSTWFRPAA